MGGGGGGGRYSQTSGVGGGGKSHPKWSGYGGQQGSLLQPSSTSEHGRSHSSKAHGSITSGSGKTVTPIPATSNVSDDSGDRNVGQYSSKVPSGGATKFAPKNFTSFPASPHNHSSSINSEMVASSSIVVPQSATDSDKESARKERQWHFDDSTPDGGGKLEVPDPNLLNWSSERRQFGLSKGEYSDNVEDPFFMTAAVGDEKEFAFQDVGEMDAKRLEEFFPALNPQIPGRYDSGVPAQCTNQSNLQT